MDQDLLQADKIHVPPAMEGSSHCSLYEGEA